jgi:hypothetical protein
VPRARGNAPPRASARLLDGENELTGQHCHFHPADAQIMHFRRAVSACSACMLLRALVVRRVKERVVVYEV